MRATGESSGAIARARRYVGADHRRRAGVIKTSIGISTSTTPLRAILFQTRLPTSVQGFPLPTRWPAGASRCQSEPAAPSG